MRNGLELERTAVAELHEERHQVRVAYQLRAKHDGHVLDDLVEEHMMRYFFPEEIEVLLAACGFELVATGAFPEIDAPLSSETWNAMIVARATDNGGRR